MKTNGISIDTPIRIRGDWDSETLNISAKEATVSILIFFVNEKNNHKNGQKHDEYVYGRVPFHNSKISLIHDTVLIKTLL